jgi:hypothetical protein
VSAVEVCNFLLGFSSDFFNVSQWKYVYLNTLYWTIYHQWAGSQERAEETLVVDRENFGFQDVHLLQSGRKLSLFEAYKHRGPLLRRFCFYEYAKFVQIRKKNKKQSSGNWIPFDEGAEMCAGKVQYICENDQHATVVLDGEITDDFSADTGNGYYF